MSSTQLPGGDLGPAPSPIPASLRDMRCDSALRLILIPAIATLALVATGCERDPRVAICPDLAVGDLVITEIRGDQSGSDDEIGEWIELYNARSAELGSGAIDLTGVVVRVRRLDGGAEGRLVFRREGIVVGPGEYVVLGRFFDFEDTLPDYINYGYADDFDSSLYDTAAVEVFACGVETDELVYRNLPATGSYSYNGDFTPSSTDNDDDANWCVDSLSGDPEATGTPGERNAICDS